MKSRPFYSKFFPDTFIQTLKIKQKWVYVYYLFNERVNWLGCYEISDRQAKFEIGDDITTSEFEEAKKVLQDANRALFVDGYVILKHTERYESHLTNKQLMKTALQQFKALPNSVKNAFLAFKPSDVIDTYKSMFQELGYTLPVAYDVGYAVDEEEIKNKEERIKNKEEERKEKETVASKRTKEEAEADRIAKHFNSLFGTEHKVTKAWYDNFLLWRDVYTLQEIGKAITSIKKYGWVWKVEDDFQPDLVLLFRTRNKAGPCDYIGQLLNRNSLSNRPLADDEVIAPNGQIVKKNG